MDIKKIDDVSLDSDVRLKSELSIGDEVKIKRFETGGTFKGKISRFIENNVDHDKNGIKVEIDNGMRGHTIKKLTSDDISKKKLFEMIEVHEGLKFELKTSYYCDTKKTKFNPSKTLVKGEYMKKIIMEEISSFMNKFGGTLCIGVTDDKEFYGFENDFRSLLEEKYEKTDYFKMVDIFKLDLLNNMEKYLGKNSLDYYDVQFMNFSKDEIENAGFKIEETKKEYEQFHVCLIKIDKPTKTILFREFVNFKNKDNEQIKGKIFKAYSRNPHGKLPIEIDTLIS
jgi:hypothetical protein